MTGLGKAVKKKKLIDEDQANGVIDVWTGLETRSIDVIGVGQGLKISGMAQAVTVPVYNQR